MMNFVYYLAIADTNSYHTACLKMPYCAIINCNSRSKKDSGLSLFRLPKVSTWEGTEHAELLRKRRAKWVVNISRADLDENCEHTRVCSKHFTSGK